MTQSQLEYREYAKDLDHNFGFHGQLGNLLRNYKDLPVKILGICLDIIFQKEDDDGEIEYLSQHVHISQFQDVPITDNSLKEYLNDAKSIITGRIAKIEDEGSVYLQLNNKIILLFATESDGEDDEDDGYGSEGDVNVNKRDDVIVISLPTNEETD